MKHINKQIALAALGTLMFLNACQEVELAEPNISTTATASSANFLLVNASPDALPLDLWVNNFKVGQSVATGTNQTTYTNVPITANGVFANSNIRSKATSGTIGGTLKTSDLIYRAGNNNTNNFQASNGLKYTVFVVDSINRPRPTRTLNSSGFGDITYYSSKDKFVAPSKNDPAKDTTIALNVASSNSIVTINSVRKYNNNLIPSFLVPVGVVPLGSSDPGGVRFYLLQDVYPTAVADKAGFRIVHASPTTPTAYVRLNPTAGGTPIVLTAATGSSYIMTTLNFNPSVGSRTVTGTTLLNFALQTVSTAGTPIEYNLEVSTKNDFSIIALTVPSVSFIASKNYTLYVTSVAKQLTAGIIQHD
jgi:hypothetical protein